MTDFDDWDKLPDFGDDSDPSDNRGDTDLPPITLGQFEIAAGVFVTIKSLDGNLPNPRDLNLTSFNEFLGIQEKEATKRVRGLEEPIPRDFDISGKNSRGPFRTREEVGTFLEKTGLEYVARVYISDLFGEEPTDDTPEEFCEWWIDIDTGGTD